jgi:hypothetical protein
MHMQSRIVFFVAALILINGCGSPENEGLKFTVWTDTDAAISDLPIGVDWDQVEARLTAPSHVVLNRGLDGRDIPSQLDDLDGDGRIDELFFLVDKPIGQEITIHMSPLQEQPAYPSRTQATLAVRQGGRFNEEGLYVDGSDWVPVDRVEVPTEQEQDSDWAMFEGPVWESDLIGYRYYLDDRFRTDVFGKRIPDLVLTQYRENYHEISDWGADILHVGTSLGLGSPAVVADTGVATIDNADSRLVEVVASGPLRSILRTTIGGWNVLGTSVDVVSELEIHAGQRWTEQRLTFTGLPDSARVATGIVRHPDAAELFRGEAADILYIYTWGPQTDQGDTMGMAILVPKQQNPAVVETDPETHVVTFDAPGDKATYRYLAAWEFEPNPIPDREAFETAIREIAERWSTTPEVEWQ